MADPKVGTGKKPKGQISRHETASKADSLRSNGKVN